jgi:prepilin-type N-terminal cleavage/methylation domain-containing protein
MKKMQKKGFTLLEILLVIALLGILVTIILVVLNPQARFASARNDIRKSDIQELELALTQYRLQEGSYPVGLDRTLREICDPDITNPAVNCGTYINLSALVPTYMQAIPQDPQDTDSIEGSGYSIAVDATRNIVSIKAIRSELSMTIALNDPLPATGTPMEVEYLVVGGGGGGGNSQGSAFWGSGGGGAGGMLIGSTPLTLQNYTITVGNGGASNSNGGNSSFGTIATAIGGGAGGNAGGGSGGNGGSGGGKGGYSGAVGTGINDQGNNGGSGPGLDFGGGGGGAGAAGNNTLNGGNGLQSNITGSNLYYAGGGGGYTGGSGGLGGGGGQNVTGTNGFGGGGGGGAGPSVLGRAGGSGIVIIRYKTDGSDGISPSSTGGTKTTSGAYTIHTFTSNGTFTPIQY